MTMSSATSTAIKRQQKPLMITLSPQRKMLSEFINSDIDARVISNPVPIPVSVLRVWGSHWLEPGCGTCWTSRSLQEGTAPDLYHPVAAWPAASQIGSSCHEKRLGRS
jgi:hypothetical protein